MVNNDLGFMSAYKIKKHLLELAQPKYAPWSSVLKATVSLFDFVHPYRCSLGRHQHFLTVG